MRLTLATQCRNEDPMLDAKGLCFMKWYLNRNGQKEEVPMERWIWGVIYKDGTELKQFDSKGNFHQIGEVDQNRVKIFVVYKPEDMSKSIAMAITQGMKFFYKYRNIRPGGQTEFKRVYMFGYKKDGQHTYNFILPDDRIIQSSVDNIDLTKFKI